MSLFHSELPHFTWPTQHDENDLINSPPSRSLLLNEVLRTIEPPCNFGMNLFEEEEATQTEGLPMEDFEEFDDLGSSLPLTDQVEATDRAINSGRMNDTSRLGHSVNSLPFPLDIGATSVVSFSSSAEWSSVAATATTLDAHHMHVGCEDLQPQGADSIPMNSPISFARVTIRLMTTKSQLMDTNNNYGAWLKQNDAHWPTGNRNEYVNEIFRRDQQHSQFSPRSKDTSHENTYPLNCPSSSLTHNGGYHLVAEPLRSWITTSTAEESEDVTSLERFSRRLDSATLPPALSEHADVETIPSTLNQRRKSNLQPLQLRSPALSESTDTNHCSFPTSPSPLSSHVTPEPAITNSSRRPRLLLRRMAKFSPQHRSRPVVWDGDWENLGFKLKRVNTDHAQPFPVPTTVHRLDEGTVNPDNWDKSSSQDEQADEQADEHSNDEFVATSTPLQPLQSQFIISRSNPRSTKSTTQSWYLRDDGAWQCPVGVERKKRCKVRSARWVDVVWRKGRNLIWKVRRRCGVWEYP
jgi:hypothetical protein